MSRRSGRRWLKRGAFGAIALVAALAGTFAVAKSECFQLVGDVTCRVETERKIVALSFDDGPTRRGLEAVLPVLDEAGVKATFFLIGKDVEASPELVGRLVNDGHEIGNHTYSHARMVGHSDRFYRDEVEKTDALLRKAGAEQLRWFRPPYGTRLTGLPRAVEKAGYHTVTWDVADRVDSNRTAEAYAEDILSRVRPGSIILMHPMYRGNTIEREALPQVIAGLQKRGYEIVPVGTLLEAAQ